MLVPIGLNELKQFYIEMTYERFGTKLTNNQPKKILSCFCV